MTTSFTPITPGACLSDQVADALAAKIRAGRLLPGAKLPTEAALVAQFSVSRTVVREALSQLKSLGLVESRQGSGVYVREAGFPPLQFDAKASVSMQAVLQMVEVRRALETEAAGLAAVRRNTKDIESIGDALRRLDRAAEAGGDGVDEDMHFHRAIAEATGNPYLIATLEYLGQFLRGATQVTRANEARRVDFARQVREEHAEIQRAIEVGDPDAAQRAAGCHMKNAALRIGQADPVFWAQAGVALARPLVVGRPDLP